MDDITFPHPHRQAALIAATQAAEVVAALLLFVKEGAATDRAFGDAEVIEKLAEATYLASQIEYDHIEAVPACRDECEALNQLASACGNHIEGWAG